jgi:hypothetical protein
MSDFENNREWANGISETLEHSTPETIMQYFIKIEKCWSAPNLSEQMLSSILQKFNISNISTIDVAVIDSEYQKIFWEVSGVHSKFKKLIDLDEDLSVRWEKVFEIIYYYERYIRTVYIINKTTTKNYTPSMNEDPVGLFKFMPIDFDKNSPYQNLLLFLMTKLEEGEYARYGGNLYTKITSKKGYSTHAWKNQMSIKKFINNSTRKETKFDQWKNLTASPNNGKSAESYLNDYEGPELMELVKDRHVFAFENGIYISKCNINTEECPEYSDIFVPYGTKHPYINSNTVACKFFKQNFDNYDEIPRNSWFEIMDKCSNFKKILDHQEFPEEVQMWLCIFMGRCAFDLGDLENWQCLMYLLGQAGTGKSTILMKILQKWYEEEDVGVISNNIDKKFGIKPHADKFMVLAPEISESFGMEQTDWQMIVEGGRNTYQEKYKSDVTIDWKSPMAMGGNQAPGFKNNSGSVSRRTAVFEFPKKVKIADTELDKKLYKEIPAIMKMCISGYLWAVNKYGTLGIWNSLPKYFHDNKEELEQATNSLQNFLSSGKVKISKDKECYCPEKIFKQFFNDHCKENSLRKDQFTSEYYKGIFENNNITVIKRTHRKYPSNTEQKVHGTFFIGVDIIDDSRSNFTDIE